MYEFSLKKTIYSLMKSYHRFTGTTFIFQRWYFLLNSKDLSNPLLTYLAKWSVIWSELISMFLCPLKFILPTFWSESNLKRWQYQATSIRFIHRLSTGKVLNLLKRFGFYSFVIIGRKSHRKKNAISNQRGASKCSTIMSPNVPRGLEVQHSQCRFYTFREIREG